MAYPEPIRPLTGKEAQSFIERFSKFKVSAEERKRLAGIKKRVKDKMSKK